MTPRERFARFAWALLAYNVLVILWGGFVRASGSGDGCGSHWPECGGEIIPVAPSVKTLIEFSHRLMSGLDGLLVLALLVWAFRAFPKPHRVRYAAAATMFLTVVEALIGAWLVKSGLVAGNTSIYRVYAISLHLCNTFLLLGALSLTALWASGTRRFDLRSQGALGWALGFGLVLTMALAATGAITALGDTLFPARDSLSAIQDGLNADSHFLVRLRLLHPLIAASVGLYLVLISGLTVKLRPNATVKRYSLAVTVVFGVQIIVGMLNIFMKAPILIQLVHLLVADLLWVSLVLMSATAMADGVAHIETDHEAEPAQSTATAKVTWKDYLVLTKPRVISLLLFTTLTAMFIAAGGWPGTTLFVAVAVGGYMAAGAANAINMVLERDLDRKMARTASRPTVTLKIPPARALVFAFCLAAGSFVLLTVFANLLSALMAFAGLVFYVIVYTLLLKRVTWQNIVIGGAAGAFPPLVGWSAVTGELSIFAWYLFAIIFLWTPVHFWALALLIKDDYKDAGVPMLPVVHGDRVTVAQIALYAVLTAIISIMPITQPGVSGMYLAVAALLNVMLLARSAQLYRAPERPQAKSLFKYSMVYLALIFLALAIDRSLHLRDAVPRPVVSAAASSSTFTIDKNASESAIISGRSATATPA